MKQKSFLEQLGLLTIGKYKFQKMLGGGSALSALYKSNEELLVFKFLIAPRNNIELERFKLEFSVLEKNRTNWVDGIKDKSLLPSLFIGPKESYPLPEVAYPLTHMFSSEINFFGYYYEQGVLLSDIDTREYSLKQKTELLHRVASGLSYFNQCGYTHRDLHPENILLLEASEMPESDNLANNPKIKILDLGNCQKIKRDYESIWDIKRDLDEQLVYSDNNKRLLTSFYSMPPDFLELGEKTENYDSWSFGVLAYSILFNKMPFELNSLDDVTQLRVSDCLPKEVELNLSSLGNGYELVLKQLLSPKGSSRPSIDTIVRLFSWLVFREDEFGDIEFVRAVINNNGFDPNYNPKDDYM